MLALSDTLATEERSDLNAATVNSNKPSSLNRLSRGNLIGFYLGAASSSANSEWPFLFGFMVNFPHSVFPFYL
jgi:hypothetical protein|tara:strand:- start:740 stop:958 length:219 start_codon:yes stop_codon:yes gene_type:complete